MKIVEVNTPALGKEWIKMYYAFYKNDANFIPHIESDIEKIFDPDKNKFYKHGNAIRYLLYDDAGKTIGRVAAFVNERTAHTYKQPTGGMGFFECIDNQEAANLLFDTCKAWLIAQGMQAMDGPINFGERDTFWGLLVENFTDPNIYSMNYNPPYYRNLFEGYGFKLYFEQYAVKRPMVEAQQTYFDKSAEIRADPNFRTTNIRGMSWDKMAQDFMTVYNDAWGGHDGFKEMSLDQAQKVVKKLKPLVDKDIVIFAYYNDKPVAFYVNIPELNQTFKYVNGKLDLIGKLKFLYHKYRRTSRIMLGIVFGVARDFQGRGVEAALVIHGHYTILPLKRYDTTIISWIGDFNPKMLKLRDNLGFANWRTWITYRYLFDRNAPFERAPMLGSEHESDKK
jgi:hypothetical protein